MKSASEDTPTDSDENSIIDLAGDDDDDESEEAPMMALTLEKQAYVDFMDTCRCTYFNSFVCNKNSRKIYSNFYSTILSSLFCLRLQSTWYW